MKYHNMAQHAVEIGLDERRNWKVHRRPCFFGLVGDE